MVALRPECHFAVAYYRSQLLSTEVGAGGSHSTVRRKISREMASTLLAPYLHKELLSTPPSTVVVIPLLVTDLLQVTPQGVSASIGGGAQCRIKEFQRQVQKNK